MKLNLEHSFDINKAKSYLNKLIEKKAKIELKEFRGKRTVSQNKYFHVCCAMLSNYAGYTIDEVKLVIKRQLEFMQYTKGGHTFCRSSADLNEEDFSKLIDFTRRFGEDHGCYIPTSEEYIESQFEIMRELNL